MRALTVQQPWAWAIVHGGKDVENRTRNIAGSYRGPVAIHAGLRWSVQGAGEVPTLLDVDDARRAYDAAFDLRTAPGWRSGVVIGVVDLIDVHAPTPWCSPWGQQGDVAHLVLANPRPLEQPIPARGRLGLWTPDPVLAAQIREQAPS